MSAKLLHRGDRFINCLSGIPTEKQLGIYAETKKFCEISTSFSYAQNTIYAKLPFACHFFCAELRIKNAYFLIRLDISRYLPDFIETN